MPWQIPLSISNKRLLLLRTGATHAHHNMCTIRGSLCLAAHPSAVCTQGPGAQAARRCSLPEETLFPGRSRHLTRAPGRPAAPRAAASSHRAALPARGALSTPCWWWEGAAGPCGRTGAVSPGAPAPSTEGAWRR